MRLITNETAAHARVRITAQWAAQERQREDKLLARLAATPEGRLRLANAIDEGRDAARSLRRLREEFPLVA